MIVPPIFISMNSKFSVSSKRGCLIYFLLTELFDNITVIDNMKFIQNSKFKIHLFYVGSNEPPEKQFLASLAKVFFNKHLDSEKNISKLTPNNSLFVFGNNLIFITTFA